LAEDGLFGQVQQAGLLSLKGGSLPIIGSESCHRRSQKGLGGHFPLKFSEHIVILCFERQYPKPNSVICLKSNILVPKIWGWLRYWVLSSGNLSKNNIRFSCSQKFFQHI